MLLYYRPETCHCHSLTFPAHNLRGELSVTEWAVDRVERAPLTGPLPPPGLSPGPGGGVPLPGPRHLTPVSLLSPAPPLPLPLLTLYLACSPPGLGMLRLLRMLMIMRMWRMLRRVLMIMRMLGMLCMLRILGMLSVMMFMMVLMVFVLRLTLAPVPCWSPVRFPSPLPLWCGPAGLARS